jgi:hypothetical protein
MPIEFVAHVTGIDDEYCLVAAIAERDDSHGHALIFQAGHEPSDEQDVRLGMDTYCVVTENHGTAYGCVRELTLDGDRMDIVIGDEALAALGLDDPSIHVQLAVEAQSIEVLQDYLGRILTYGRVEAQPAVLRL